MTSPDTNSQVLATPPSVPLESLRDVLDAYRTCELATIARDGTPVAWPAVFLVRPDAGGIVLTTSIALPRKAFNIRRDPRVALLFSDPTGSERADLPQVLVRGTASCPDEIHTAPDGLEAYWRRLAEIQPASRDQRRFAAGRWFFDWYYMRLVITVTPETVSTRPMSAQRSPLAAPRPGRGDRTLFADICRRLPAYSSAVLSTQAADVPPELRRVRLLADPTAQRLVLEDPGSGPVMPGSATLLFHGHDEKLGNLTQFALRGEVLPSDGGWAFRPDRLLPGPEAANPIALVRTMVQLRRTADRYLERRGLDRPRIDWDAHDRAAVPLTS